ncbi:putative integral membrane protein conserved region-domain-containing protein [Aspergillus undulatus]|uniref:putative integral membrane protein conserved region-domain-containing protein n=1 Tax=Aspergillus undulatus TaxID=1810928 RepID=UPI003CCD8D0E
MGLFISFLLFYLFGGLTFIPLIFSLFLLYSYLALPSSPPQAEHVGDSSDSTDNHIRRPHDDQYSLKSGTDELAEEFYRTHDTDVAAGYFVVCREYVPGGVNGKPPERTTPTGEVIAAESPSVYQAMYRSLFDRRQAPTIDPGKNAGKGSRRIRNMFYIVLRHGHLMLYDDANQVEVRYVISLAHHDVSIYGGELKIPESELWLKKNAISLSRRLESLGDLGGPTPPFFFFSENLSDKEDFYFAMLQNQARMGNPPHYPPSRQDFDVKHIVALVQRLHSSEEQLQTRWINAVLGRIFLALYRTPEMEDFVRTKIIKKISRVNKPSFISKIGLRNIDMGNGAPFIINPRLKDLTVDGNCCVETDVQYTGNFRVEITATVRIDLGQRFKAKEVDIILAVVLKKLEGHLLIRFKPPPSNRAWVSFETTPNMVMDIEPIVSSKQITYGIILRTIESKIREMVADSVVLPFWDDVPFLDTLAQQFRGGIWQRESWKPGPTVEIPDESGCRPQVPEDSRDSTARVLKSKDDRTMSAPVLSESSTNSTEIRKKSGVPERSDKGFSTALSAPNEKSTKHPLRAIRARTFSHTAVPVLTADHGQPDGIMSDYKNEEQCNAASAMIEITGRSTTTPNKAPQNSPPKDDHNILEAMYHSRNSSIAESIESTVDTQCGSPRRSSFAQSIEPASNKSGASHHSSSSLTSNEAPWPSALEGSSDSMTASIPLNKNYQGSLTLGTATSIAKKWGLNVFGRGETSTGQGPGVSRPSGTPEEPMGRGHPLPPPGTPLPTPAKVNNKRNSVSIPKRKPVPPTGIQSQDSPEDGSKSIPQSLFSRRKPVFGADDDVGRSDELLVIEAPYESAPSSPADLLPTSNLTERGTDRGHKSSTQNDTEAQSQRDGIKGHNVEPD